MPSNGEPVFFLSYARTAGSRRVVDFFNDLSTNIADLVDPEVGAEPGFMDKSIPGGGRWTDELLHAVGSCHVFVALLSMPFLNSTWCGMEWYAFARRRVVDKEGGSPRRTAILPVIWAPWPGHVRIPAAVSEVQRFSPEGLPDAEITTLYRDEGLLGLQRIRPDAYESVVWRLARRVADIAYTHPVEPRVLRREHLRDIFQEST
ncbi:TIR-like protein FxsC [Actinomadura fulvescens]|uniref:TIR domain-containing protein n=1 Tax=Actinomadura fulvescens TaxID=46160 RepID=A0ABN3PIQ6_9ACTN